MCAAGSESVDLALRSRFADEECAGGASEVPVGSALSATRLAPDTVFLGREGIDIGKDHCGRLWAEHGLQVPKKRSTKRIATGRPRPMAPMTANAVWSDDSVFDACANGRQLTCLTVVDEFTRESLAIDVTGFIRSARVIEVLSKLISVPGAPRDLRSDNVLNAST